MNNKKEKYKKIIKQMLEEDDSFLNVLTGTDSEYNNVLNKINDRAKKINTVIQNAKQSAK